RGVPEPGGYRQQEQRRHAAACEQVGPGPGGPRRGKGSERSPEEPNVVASGALWSASIHRRFRLSDITPGVLQACDAAPETIHGASTENPAVRPHPSTRRLPPDRSPTGRADESVPYGCPGQ